MQLRRLEVRNIRSFESADLELGPGTTLLVGDVGAGKSSLLYAVEMALFGVAEVDAAYLVRHGTTHAEVAVTLADGEHTHTVRRRFRRVRRRGRESYEPEKLTYAHDGRSTAYSATEIRQRVIDIVGFPDNPNPHAHSDLWRWAIYVPQERMREILAAHPEERLETVRKALGVERFRTAAENAQLLASDLRVGARHRREEAERLAHWDTELAETVAEADRLRANRIHLVAGVDSAESALARARGVRSDREASLARSDADRRELESLERENAGALQRHEEAVRRQAAVGTELSTARKEAEGWEAAKAVRLRAVDADRSCQETLRSCRAELERAAAALPELARRTAELQAAVRRKADAAERTVRGRDELARAERALDELRGTGPAREPPAPTPRGLPAIDEELTQARGAERDASDALLLGERTSGQLDELLHAGVCPTCHQNVRSEAFEAHRDEAVAAVGRLRTAREAATTRREQLEEERKARDRFERAHERWKELERRLQEATEAATSRRRALAESERAEAAADRETELARTEQAQLLPAEEEARRRRSEVAAAEQAGRSAADALERATREEDRRRAAAELAVRLAEESARLTSEIASARTRDAGRTERIASLRAALAAVASDAEALAAARSAEGSAERQLQELRESRVRTDARLDALVERQQLCERGRGERAARLAEAADLEEKAAWVGEPFRAAVLRMEKDLLAHAQAAFDRAFARYFASLVDDPSLTARTDASFTPEVSAGEEITPAEALSGGERTSLALAFRLALADVVRSLGQVRLATLLLDEPTDGFSSEQVVRMGELLSELALPQVIVVSHESQLTGIADRTVRVTKVDGTSRLELAEPRSDPEAAPELTPTTSDPRRTR